MRQVPDITAAGDAQYTFYVAGSWGRWAGTSFGTPLWAAGITLINQYLAAHGETRLGFLNPTLYTILRTPEQYAAAFHDITTGDNCFDASSTCGTPDAAGSLYPATAGYDLASGIGSPHFGNLAAALLSIPLAPTIASIAPNSGPAAGGNRVTITGTNFVAGMRVWFGANFVPATNVVVLSSTTITATAPASTGTVMADVTLETPAPGDARVTRPGAYRYLPGALPGPAPSGSVQGNPGALPNPRTPGATQTGAVQPIPPHRP
jgi:subtilase family serine protease